MPLDRSHVDAVNQDVATIAQSQAALDAAKAGLLARLDSLAAHMNDGDIYSLTGQVVPVVTKQGGKVQYLLVPAVS